MEEQVFEARAVALAQLEEDVLARGSNAADLLSDVLGVLRSVGRDESDLAPPPRAADIERAVEASRVAGVRAELTMDVVELPDAVARTAQRVLREGLTNVHKHARGAVDPR